MPQKQERPHQPEAMVNSFAGEIGAIELLGIHPKVLYRDREGNRITLLDTLEKDGYGGGKSAEIQVREVLDNSQDQKRMLVIKANKEITDFDSLVEEIRIGLEILENRHNRGKEELQSFVDAVRRGDQCLRRLFAPQWAGI